ncbi:hypothetical protein [Microbacterium arborescens]|uniref:hypothetical protein n=1 Tax=Microbacterium arborescens TaxID=33883 RepID=UPI000DF75CB0|nr:hypothetical protein [Microbacterium arborescens]
MAVSKRTQVQAIDDLTEQLRISNLLAAVALPATALAHDPGTRAQTAAAKANVARRNAIRAQLREALDAEDAS